MRTLPGRTMLVASWAWLSLVLSLVLSLLLCLALSACSDRAAETGSSTESSELLSLRVEWRVTEHAPFQSRRPFPPWDRSPGHRTITIDLENRRFAELVDAMGMGGYPYHRQVAIDGERSFEANFYDGYRRAIDPSELPDRSAELVRFTAPLLLRLGETQDGASDRLRLPTGEIATLGFGDGGDLEWAEMVLADGTEQRVSYGDFEQIDGVSINRTARVEANGELWLEIETSSVSVNETIDASLELLHPVEEVLFEPTPEAWDWKFLELAPGVHFVGDTVWHGLFVERDDHLVAVGAVRDAERRVEAVAERFPDKPLRATIVTHHHDDHLEGIAAHAAAGSLFYTSPGHLEIVARHAGDAQVLPVDGELVLTGSGPTVRVLQAGPMTHSEEMLVVEIVEPKILWSADLYVQHPGRPLRAVNPAIRDLAGFIERSGSVVERLVDPHTPKINTIDELLESRRTEPTIEGVLARADRP